MKTYLVLAVALVSASVSHSVSAQFTPVNIGNQLHREYTQYDDMPVTAAAAATMGWSAYNSTCNPSLGIAYASVQGGPTKDAPVTLYFTSAGQVSGMGVEVFGKVEANMVAKGFLIPLANGNHYMSVSFRVPSAMCSGAADPSLTLGNQLVLNQGALNYPLPTTDKEALAAGWTKGSCFSTMGTHWFRDISTGPAMSWDAGNLVPVTLMYNDYNNGTGLINAFFFTATTAQQSLFNGHMWDPVSLLPSLMCDNFCDKSCHWPGTYAFATMHVYLSYYKTVTCPDNCHISCCPGPGP